MKFWQYFILVLSVFIIYLLVMFFCRRTLKKIETVTVVGALVRGEVQAGKKKRKAESKVEMSLDYAKEL